MRQALRFTKETVPGTFNSGATGSDVQHIRITGDGAFPDRSVPNIYYVRDAAGSNRNVQVDYGTKTALLRFETLLYPSQAGLLLPWGINLVAAGLHLKPAYTFTVDHLIQLEDDTTVLYKRYLGATPGDFTIRANNQGDGMKFTLSSTFWILGVATITISNFPTPTLASFPSDKPFKFQQLSGGVTVGSVRTSFKSLELSVKHMTKGLYDESVYPQKIGWYGRDTSLKIDFRHKSNVDRAALEAVTAQSVGIVLSDGTTTATISMYDTNIITGVTDSLPLGDAYYQGVTSMTMVDATAGTDMSVAITP